MIPALDQLIVSILRVGLALICFTCVALSRDGRARYALMAVFLIFAWGGIGNGLMWYVRHYEPNWVNFVRAWLYNINYLYIAALAWLAVEMVKAKLRKGRERDGLPN